MKKLIFFFIFIVTFLNSYAQSEIAKITPNTNSVNELKEPEVDTLGNIKQKTIHRLNDQVILISPFGVKPKNGLAAPAPGLPTATIPITYHNGPVMTQVSSIYVIWYGNWNSSNGSDTPSGQQIIRDALYGLSVNAGLAGNGQSYSGVTTGANTSFGLYTQSATLVPANGSVTAISSPRIYEYTDSYSQGKTKTGSANLSDAGVTAVVKNAMAKAVGWSIPDPNAIYLVLTSSDVNESSGFCSKYCGWHTYTTTLNTAKTSVKYAFIGNANRCIANCAPQATSPNGNPGVDGMVSVIAHELIETVTDPQLNAWTDASGAENGDKCAWTFGGSTGNMTNTSGPGPFYNVTLPTQPGQPNPTRNYLIQRALAPANSKCYVDASGNQ